MVYTAFLHRLCLYCLFTPDMCSLNQTKEETDKIFRTMSHSQADRRIVCISGKYWQCSNGQHSFKLNFFLKFLDSYSFSSDVKRPVFEALNFRYDVDNLEKIKVTRCFTWKLRLKNYIWYYPIIEYWLQHSLCYKKLCFYDSLLIEI